MPDYRIATMDEFPFQHTVKDVNTQAALEALILWTKGDRYILTDGANATKIAYANNSGSGTYVAVDWTYITPAAGWICWSDSANEFYKFNGSWGLYFGAIGPTGATGATGPAGSSPTGPTGATGPQGPANSNNQTLNYGSPATFVNISAGYQIYCDQGFFNNGGVRGHVVNANNLYFYNNSSSQWYSNGAIGAGGGNFFPASTREIKKNIEPFTKSALDIINSTDIVSFEFEITDLEGETHIGFIAEDTAEELATSTHDQMVVPSSLSILMKAIQELDKKLQVLENNA